MRFVLVLAWVAACDRPTKHEVDPVSLTEAREFAARFGSAAKPCNVDRLAELIDGPAMTEKLASAARSPAAKNASARMDDPHIQARILCSWNETAESYHVLHVVADTGGTPRVVMRRLVREPRKHIVIVGYDKLELGKSRDDHKVRLVDLYSVSAGLELSALIADGMDALGGKGFSGGLDAVEAVKAIRELQKQGKYAAALAKLDALPDGVRRARSVQMMRVGLAEAISVDVYKQAVDELVKQYPDDPSVAQLAVDAAFLNQDYDGALRDIDIVDRAVGGDAFQDAVRAETYLKRGQPGDLERAAERAEAAIKAEPTLAKGWYARLDVAVQRKDYGKAIETIDHLREHFGAKLDDAALRTIPSYADFVASPEYGAWIHRGG